MKSNKIHSIQIFHYCSRINFLGRGKIIYLHNCASQLKQTTTSNILQMVTSNAGVQIQGTVT